jgi:hypothetical protein
MTDNPADTELGGKKSPRRERREKLKQQILDEHGAVKYDGEETEGSPFQGMYVYDGGKSAFAEDTLNAWIDSRMHLIDEYVAGVIGEVASKCPNCGGVGKVDCDNPTKTVEENHLADDCEYCDWVRAEQRRRAGIGEK